MPPRTPLPLFPAIDWLQRRTRRQWIIAAVLVAFYVAYRASNMAANIVLDRWWFETVTDAPVWSTMTIAKLQLAVAAGVITALVLGPTVWLVLRSKPVGKRPINLQLRKYHE